MRETRGFPPTPHSVFGFSRTLASGALPLAYPPTPRRARCKQRSAHTSQRPMPTPFADSVRFRQGPIRTCLCLSFICVHRRLLLQKKGSKHSPKTSAPSRDSWEHADPGIGTAISAQPPPRHVLSLLVQPFSLAATQLAQFTSPQESGTRAAASPAHLAHLMARGGRVMKSYPLASCRHPSKLRRREGACSSGGSPSRKTRRPVRTGGSWSPCAQPVARASARSPAWANWGPRAGGLGGYGPQNVVKPGWGSRT